MYIAYYDFFRFRFALIHLSCLEQKDALVAFNWKYFSVVFKIHFVFF